MKITTTSVRMCIVSTLCAVLSFLSCTGVSASVVTRSAEGPVPPVPSYIMGTGHFSASGLATFLLAHNPSADPERVHRIAQFYIEEASFEGVNSDIAFVQMCLETGFLGFGGLVSPEMNNFAGLGSIGPGQPGLSFPDERIGVRAHIQHLKSYGSPDPLVGELVNPRRRFIVPLGKSPQIAGLAGTWAADPEYGIKLDRLLRRLYGV